MVQFSRARSSPSLQKPFSRRAFNLSAYRIIGCHDSADGVSQQASPISGLFVDFDFEARILWLSATCVMIEKVGDSGNVKNFIAEGYIAQKNEETFRLQVEAGHAGMHRNYVPTKEELDVLLSITESLIETVYVNPHQAKTLKEIPPREGK